MAQMLQRRGVIAHPPHHSAREGPRPCPSARRGSAGARGVSEGDMMRASVVEVTPKAIAMAGVV